MTFLCDHCILDKSLSRPATWSFNAMGSADIALCDECADAAGALPGRRKIPLPGRLLATELQASAHNTKSGPKCLPSCGMAHDKLCPVAHLLEARTWRLQEDKLNAEVKTTRAELARARGVLREVLDENKRMFDTKTLVRRSYPWTVYTTINEYLKDGEQPVGEAADLDSALQEMQELTHISGFIKDFMGPAAASKGSLNDLASALHRRGLQPSIDPEIDARLIAKAKERARAEDNERRRLAKKAKRAALPRCAAVSRKGNPCPHHAHEGAGGLCMSHAAGLWGRYVKQQRAAETTRAAAAAEAAASVYTVKPLQES